MGKYDSAAALRRRRKHLAACVAAIFGVAAHGAFANVTVLNCNDAGAGSLRAAVAAAADGDVVDMTGLTSASPGCSSSTITLRTGDIVVAQNNLNIAGPGANKLVITGKYGSFPSATIEPYRLFTHTGTGQLEISGVTLSKGYAKASSAIGGCIASSGNVYLYRANIYGCRAVATPSSAVGGAIYSAGFTKLKYSTVSESSASAGASGVAGAGGIFAGNGLTMKYSTLTGNSADGPASNNVGSFGAAEVVHAVSIRHSTISNNYAAGVVGGLALFGTSTDSVTIRESTISGNRSGTSLVGGMYIKSGATVLANDTIAFNSAATQSTLGAPGVAIFGGTLDLESTLIANNYSGSLPDAGDLATSGTTITGANNLVRASVSTLPPDTIRNTCPLLGKLRDNGGATQTHALLSRSRGIDEGANPNSDTEDQRSLFNDSAPFPYPRSSGIAPDIGAYEVQQADIIFDTAFEGCVGIEF